MRFGKARWESLHVLRAAAATIVVAHHVPQFLLHRVSYPVRQFEAGAVGVDIFFVISGFVMYCATAAKPQNWQDFLARRAIRIIPMYWLTTIAVTLAVWVMPSAFAKFRVTSEQFVKSLFFIPVYDAVGSIRPVIAVGWTLHFELMFYLLVAAALAFKQVRAALAAAGTVALAVVVCGLLGLPQPHSAWQLLAPIAAEFSLGVLLAHTLHSTALLELPVALRAGVSAGLLAFGVWLISRVAPLDVGLERALYWGGGSLALVGALALLEPELAGATQLRWTYDSLGDASYALYLIHGSVFPIVWKLVPAGGRESVWVAWVVLLVAPVILSVPVHYWVELPVTRTLSKLVRGERTRARQLRPNPSE